MRYGDIILFTPTGLIGKLICKIDGSKYSHGAIYLGQYHGEHLFIESHEKRGGVCIRRLEEWRRNYIILRPNYIVKPKSKEDVIKLLNRKYDYARLWWIFKSKILKLNLQNDDPYRLICTELCDFVWHYNLGSGNTCTPNTIYRLYKDGKLDII